MRDRSYHLARPVSLRINGNDEQEKLVRYFTGMSSDTILKCGAVGLPLKVTGKGPGRRYYVRLDDFDQWIVNQRPF